MGLYVKYLPQKSFLPGKLSLKEAFSWFGKDFSEFIAEFPHFLPNADEKIGDLSGGELLKELLYYGVSSINLSTTGSGQQGVRACTSRMKNELYPVMEERMKEFRQDHPII